MTRIVLFRQDSDSGDVNESHKAHHGHRVLKCEVDEHVLAIIQPTVAGREAHAVQRETVAHPRLHRHSLSGYR